MLPIIKSIEEYVLSLPKKELVALAVSNKEQDFQLSFTNIEDLRNQVFNEITSGYEEAYHIISKNVEIVIENISNEDKEVLEANNKIARELSDKELLDIAKAGFKDDGVSDYKIDEEKVEINIFIELKEMFEKSELSTKIFKLVEPSKIIISFNDDELYQNTFNREFVVSDWGVWGLFPNTLVD